MAFASCGGSIATTGMGTVLQLASLFRTFDESFLKFKDILEKLKDDPREFTAIVGLVAGISETAGPSLYAFHTYRETNDRGEFIGGMEPYKFYDAGTEFCSAPTPEPRAFKDSKLPCYWACDGLAEYGGDFFDLLRQTKMQHLVHPDKPWLYGVGGHVDHTVINADGCAVTRLRTWPQDVPGKKVEPFAA